MANDRQTTEYALNPQREVFAQRRAMGDEPIEAYCFAYRPGEPIPTDPDERARLSRYASLLTVNTTVRLRIQELQLPAFRRMRHKLEYTVQQGLRQAQIAYDLAYADGDGALILKCVEMQAKLCKLLSEEINVNHKHGILDDASTQTLLAMKAAFDKANKKKELEGPIVEGELIPEPPIGPLF